MAEKKTVSKVVAWCVPKRALIKFDGEDDSVTISKNVIEKIDFAKYPLAKGDTVDVSIEGEEVVYIRKSSDTSSAQEEKVEAKEEVKAEEKVETKASDDSVELTKEVYCVSKYGLKFVGDNDWTNFIDELQKKDFRSMGVVARNIITVVIKNGKIVEIKKVEEAKKSESKEEKSSSTRKSSYRDEESTDKRTASMNAKDVVVALINANREEVNSTEKIEKAINGLTKKFYDVTKNL